MSEVAVLCPVEDALRTNLAALRAIADETAEVLGGRVVSQELLRKTLPLESTSLCLRVVVQTPDGRYDD